MTQKEILDREADNTGSIWLYLEGSFYKAYERSAFAFCTRIREYKTLRKESKTLRRGIRIYGARDGYTNSGVEDSVTYLQALEHMSSAYRLLVSSKTKAALSRKKDAGEKLGRPDGSCVKMRILIRNKQHIRSALDNGESISSLCSRYNVSRSTFRRFLKHTGASVDQSNQRKMTRNNHK